MNDISDILLGIAGILKSVAWPATVGAIALCLRRPLVIILLTLAKKIGSATKIKFTRTGFELAAEVGRRTVASPPDGTVPQGPDDARIAFERGVVEYDALATNQNNTERVAERQRLADLLGALAVQLNISRKILAEDGRDGCIVALATAAIRNSKPGDLRFLAAAARSAKSNFTRYRIVLALIEFLDRHHLDAKTLRIAETVIDSVERRDDVPTTPSLQRLVDRTRESINSLLPSA